MNNKIEIEYMANYIIKQIESMSKEKQLEVLNIVIDSFNKSPNSEELNNEL